MNTDVIIVGGGVIGTAIARELSRFNLEIILVEKEADVANGTSKANSGIVHAGYNASSKTVKGKLNVQANSKFDKLCNNLNVPFSRIGSLVVGFNDDDLEKLKEEKRNGESMGVKGLEIISGERLFEFEPHINRDAQYALYAPTAGIVSPYELAIAYADNAVVNGVKVLLNTEVKDLLIEDGTIKGVVTNRGKIESEMVINAAGVFAGEIAKMGGDNINIRPRKGEYHLYDKEYGNFANHVLFPLPNETSKGILITPTVHGNLLIGPNSYFIDDKDDVSTTKEGLKEVVKGANKLISGLPANAVITSFSGLRAAAESEDFEIGFSADTQGLINVAGIQSPGLTSAPAIADKVVNMVEEFTKNNSFMGNLEHKDDFQATLPEYPSYENHEDNKEEWQKFVAENEDYGEVICRCEKVTRGEIIDAIQRPVPARTVDAIKRRTRAGSGRCQGGFCGPRVVEILAEELDISPLEVTKMGNKSNILKARSKEMIDIDTTEEIEIDKTRIDKTKTDIRQVT